MEHRALVRKAINKPLHRQHVVGGGFADDAGRRGR
jgi:hypothetical protein